MAKLRTTCHDFVGIMFVLLLVCPSCYAGLIAYIALLYHKESQIIGYPVLKLINEDTLFSTLYRPVIVVNAKLATFQSREVKVL